MNNFNFISIFFSYILPSTIAVTGLILVARHNSKSTRQLAYQTWQLNQLEEFRSQIKSFAMSFIKRSNLFHVELNSNKANIKNPEVKKRLLEYTLMENSSFKYYEITLCLASINDKKIHHDSAGLGILESKFIEYTKLAIESGEIDEKEERYITELYVFVVGELLKRSAELSREYYDVEKSWWKGFLASAYLWK